ncbi:MAG: DUF2007 domain-containing protein [Chloroflexi bacterium]|nr:DUF2007 domain-containing protein [Chloroflexota bacterium]
MANAKPNLVVIERVQGELAARVIKGHLESEGIPVVLSYESAGVVMGVIIDGLGEVRIMVPEAMAERAREIIKPGAVSEED